MTDFRHRRGRRAALVRLGLRTLGVLGLLLVTIVAARGAWDMYGKFVAASDAQTDAQTQLAQLQAQYAQVHAQAQDLSTTRGQEAQLRQRYGVAKAGEGEIDIVRQASTTPGDTGADAPWWERLW